MTRPPRRANSGRAINGVKALPGAASSHGTGLLLQLGSDFLEEPSCSIGEGSGADIARFGIAAEAPIFPKSDPIARIHSVFGIDQMLQGLHVDFPSGLLDRFGDTQQRPVLVILLCPLPCDLQARIALGHYAAPPGGPAPTGSLSGVVEVGSSNCRQVKCRWTSAVAAN